MLTDPISSGATSSATGGKSARDAQIALAESFDGFLKLLTTQLTN